MTSTSMPTVSLTVDDSIARIVIDNPARANALDRSMLATLADHVCDAARRPDVSVIVLSGAGSNFSAGLNISEISENPAWIEDEFVRVEEIIAQCPKPTIAAIRGHCVGGGTQLALACDLRIATTQARFAITPAKIGLVYPTNSIDRVVRIIGSAATKRLIFTADAIDSATALHYGLITDVVDESIFDTSVDRIAATIATRSPTTISAAKQMTDDAALHGRVTDELRHHWRSAANPDLPIGLAAFAAKTDPVFDPATHDSRKECSTNMFLTSLDPTRLSAADTAAAITVGQDSLTRTELYEVARALGEVLPDHGPAAVYAQPTLETVVAVTACLLAGVTVVPVPPDSGSAELQHILSDAGVTYWVGTPHPTSELPSIPVHLDARTQTRTVSAPNDDDPAMIMYTSGTTGAPKGVVLSYRALAAGIDALAEAWQWTADDTVVHGLPLFHLHGLVLGVLGSLRIGSRVIHTEKPKPELYAKAKGTMYFAVPTVWSRIAADEKSARALRGARLLVSGSAPLPTPVFDRITELTGIIPVERYGMSETMVTLSTRVDGRREPGSVGQAVRGVQTRLLTESGQIVPDDGISIGRLQVRGPMLFDSYLNRPTDTADTWTDDGWFNTGDVATRDADGYHRIVGRESVDLIKSGGYRIGAGEVETALLAHPAVEEVAVVGHADPDLGQRVVAYVVTEEPVHTSLADALISFVTDSLSHHKRPREVVFVDSLPRNTMGKVQKKRLQQQSPTPTV